MSRQQSLSILGIIDGSSNTILLAEVRASRSAQDPRGVWAMGLTGSSTIGGYAIGDARTINARNSGADDVRGCVNSWNTDGMGCCQNCASNQALPRSQHTGGVNASMGDASVRFFRDSIAQRTLYILGAAADGQVTPPDAN